MAKVGYGWEPDIRREAGGHDCLSVEISGQTFTGLLLEEHRRRIDHHIPSLVPARLEHRAECDPGLVVGGAEVKGDNFLGRSTTGQFAQVGDVVDLALCFA
ncbi:hypothetical protein [Brevundimonas sp. TWP2-3-2]|uniref:hypothetical protein n=1 Tax=unclassified Brevundimonas TaxID=2622653 RepID=UPI003CF8EBAF